jgi:hypothetical protein
MEASRQCVALGQAPLFVAGCPWRGKREGRPATGRGERYEQPRRLAPVRHELRGSAGCGRLRRLRAENRLRLHHLGWILVWPLLWPLCRQKWRFGANDGKRTPVRGVAVSCCHRRSCGIFGRKWSGRLDSNQRPPALKAKEPTQLGAAGDRCPSFFLGNSQLGATAINREPLPIVSQLSANG